MVTRPHHPVLKWAQRKGAIFLTLELRDLVDEKVDISDSQISFKGTSDKKEYEFHYEFFQDINKETSKWSKTGFHMIFQLDKKEPKWWVRLVKESKKNTYIQVDWDKWVDEDEEGEEGQKGLDKWDPSAMQGFGGEEEDSDDEPANLADLDEEEKKQQKTQ